MSLSPRGPLPTRYARESTAPISAAISMRMKFLMSSVGRSPPKEKCIIHIWHGQEFFWSRLRPAEKTTGASIAQLTALASLIRRFVNYRTEMSMSSSRPVTARPMTMSDQSPISRPNSRLVALKATGVVAIRKRLGALGSGCALIFVPYHRSRTDAEWDRGLFLVRIVTGEKIRIPVAILQPIPARSRARNQSKALVRRRLRARRGDEPKVSRRDHRSPDGYAVREGPGVNVCTSWRGAVAAVTGIAARQPNCFRSAAQTGLGHGQGSGVRCSGRGCTGP